MKSHKNNIPGTEFTEKKPRSKLRLALKIFLRTLTFLFVCVLLICVALLTAIWVVSKGPSPTAQTMFVLTVKETSAAGFLADIFLSEEEVYLIQNPPGADDSDEQTDTSLIQIQPEILTIQTLLMILPTLSSMKSTVRVIVAL